MPAKKKTQKKKPSQKKAKGAPKKGAHNLKKVTPAKHKQLKGRLVEVRRIGANVIYVECKKGDTIGALLKKGDVPTGTDTKVEAASKDGKWETVTMKTPAEKYERIAVTTKVNGAC